MPLIPIDSRTFRALKSRECRRYFAAIGISFTGSWIESVALAWLVYRMTGSTLMLGVMSFMSTLPTFFLSPVAGWLVDRFPHRLIIIWTQMLSVLLSLVLAAMTLTGEATIGRLMAMAVLSGTVVTLDLPARQAFLSDLVFDAEDLMNAIALNSSMVNISRMIGPAVAGFVISLFGEGWCFFINSLSYVPVAVVVAGVGKGRGVRPERVLASFHQELLEGFSYVRSTATVRNALLLIFVVSMTALSFSLLMPVYSRDILKGGPHTMGFLTTAGGIGAFAGTLFLARRTKVAGLWRTAVWGAGTLGGALIGFAFSTNLALSLVLLTVVGCSATILVAGSNAVVQTVTPYAMRGRAMSFFTMALLGSAPFGDLLLGALAARIGPVISLALAGGCAVAAAVGFLFRRVEDGESVAAEETGE